MASVFHLKSNMKGCVETRFAGIMNHSISSMVHRRNPQRSQRTHSSPMAGARPIHVGPRPPSAAVPPPPRQTCFTYMQPPRTEEYYKRHLKPDKSGFLMLSEGRPNEFHKRWFELKRGRLCVYETAPADSSSYHSSGVAPLLKIHLEDTTLSSREMATDPVIVIRTNDTSYYLAAATKDEFRDWTLAFQSTIAILIDKILKHRKGHSSHRQHPSHQRSLSPEALSGRGSMPHPIGGVSSVESSPTTEAPATQPRGAVQQRVQFWMSASSVDENGGQMPPVAARGAITFAADLSPNVMQPTPAPVIGSMPAGFSSTHTMTARIQLTSAGVGNLLPQAFGAPNLRDLRSFPGGVHVPFRGSITVREMMTPLTEVSEPSPHEGSPRADDAHPEDMFSISPVHGRPAQDSSDSDADSGTSGSSDSDSDSETEGGSSSSSTDSDGDTRSLGSESSRASHEQMSEPQQQQVQESRSVTIRARVVLSSPGDVSGSLSTSGATPGSSASEQRPLGGVVLCEIVDMRGTALPPPPLSVPPRTAYVPPHLRAKPGNDSPSSTATSVSSASSHSTGFAPSTGGYRPRRAPVACMPPSSPPLDSTPKAYTSECRRKFLSDSSGTSCHGLFSTQGVRTRMEDRHVAIDDVSKSMKESSCVSPMTLPAQHSLYAVFDGHGGVHAADMASSQLPSYIFGHDEFVSSPCVAMSQALLRFDTEYVTKAHSLPNEREWGAGTTALMVLRRGDVLHVANLGDSRAVLSRGGVAKQLSQDHTPESDKARIESAGGWITTDRELPFRKLQDMDLEDPLVKGLAKETMKWNIVTRVNGELAVARSLGDADYKLGARMSSYEWCYPDRIPRSFTSDVVSNVADTCEIDMQPDDEFMVLACDGLWEVLSPQNVVDLTKAFLKDGSSPEVAAEKLVDWAIRLGSQDNITAIVVLLR